MKKFIIPLIICLFAINCSAQNSMLSTLYTNRVQYYNYLTNGSTVQALRSGERLLQGESLMQGYFSTSGALNVRLPISAKSSGLYGILRRCGQETEYTMGKRMSAQPSCAMQEVSWVSTMEWTMDCG